MTTLGAMIVLGGLFVLVNGVAYEVMRHDKRMAREGGWRISEAAIIGLAMLGGGIGTKIAQRRFRHKTRKQPIAGLITFALLCNLVIYSLALHQGTRAFALNAASGALDAVVQAGPERRPARPTRFGPGSGS